MVKELDLTPIDKLPIQTIDKIKEFDIFAVNIEFHGKTYPSRAFGLGHEGNQLIGRDILNKYHICLDGKRQILEILDDKEKEKK